MNLRGGGQRKILFKICFTMILAQFLSGKNPLSEIGVMIVFEQFLNSLDTIWHFRKTVLQIFFSLILFVNICSISFSCHLQNLVRLQLVFLSQLHFLWKLSPSSIKPISSCFYYSDCNKNI